MRRFLIVAVVVGVVFTAGIATGQLAIRHALLDSTAIYTANGMEVDGAKVMYLRDNANPETCTQIIVIGGNPTFAVPAHRDSCVD